MVAPPSAACEASRQATERALAALPARLSRGARARWPVLDALGACVSAGRGWWSLRLERATADREEPRGEPVLEGVWALVYEDPSGAVAITHPWSEGPEASGTNLLCAPEDTCTRILAPTVFDHDGDGVAELALVVRAERPWVDGGLTGTSYGVLWTVREGRVVPYGPTRAVPVLEHRDIDGDGRPDLYTHGPYVAEAPGPCGRNGWVLTGPRFLLHARPDGGFSATDAAARRGLDCEAPEDTSNGGAQAYRLGVLRAAREVVCARVRDPRGVALPRALEEAPALHPRGCRNSAPGDLDVLREWACWAPWVVY